MNDGFVQVFTEVEALLREARRDQVAEALRLLACEVAYCSRYRKRPSLAELLAQVSKAHRDEETMGVVVDGMLHLAEVLAQLRVPVPQGSQCLRLCYDCRAQGLWLRWSFERLAETSNRSTDCSQGWCRRTPRGQDVNTASSLRDKPKHASH